MSEDQLRSSSEGCDTLYSCLRSLERRGARDEDFRLLIDDFLKHEPAARTALPEFSTFGLLEALRESSALTPLVSVGRYSATPEQAIALMRHLSEEDVSMRHPWYNANHPHFNTIIGTFGGLFFGIATPGSFATSLIVGALGALFCFAIASLVRFEIRNSTRRRERPQWICALHVDRYLQAYHRGLPLNNLHVEDLPNPGFRRKAPFYDLHNQIMQGPNWTYHPNLHEAPELTFSSATPPTHAS